MSQPSDLPIFPAASDCDPLQLGWMQGSPPSAGKIIQAHDGSGYRFPQLRWSFAHYRQLVPTATVSKGLTPSTPLPKPAASCPKSVTAPWATAPSAAGQT